MYRPQSQLSRQRSSEVRDMQSKTKRLTNKQYKEYVKKLIQNNPNHIDTDRERKLKIDTAPQSRKNQLKERIEKKTSGDDEKEMWRSGVARFIKPKLSQRDYKRFKKLFEIFSKIQKTKQQIFTLTFSQSNNRYIKDSNSLFQNQKVKQLKEKLLRLQLDQEKILLEIDNQSKQNKRESFSLQKMANSHQKKSEIMIGRKRFSDIQSKEVQGRGEKYININNTIDSQSPTKSQQHKRIQSSQQCNSNSPINLSKQPQLLFQLYQLIQSIDSGKHTKRSSTKSKRDKSYEPQSQQSIQSVNTMYEEVRNFIITKQKTINSLFATLTTINNINHKDYQVVVKEEQSSSRSIQKMVRQSQFNKFHQIDKRQRNLYHQQVQNVSSNINTNSNINNNKKYNSFKGLFQQIEQDLTQYKQMGVVKQRSNELARRLLTTSKQLKLCEQDKIQTQKQLTKRILEQQAQNSQLKIQYSQFLLLNKQLQTSNQQLHKQIKQQQSTILQLQNRIKQLEQSQQQYSNFQKYYRETLTLQQQVKILSQQNEKLVQELHQYKQKLSKQKQKDKLQCKLQQQQQEKKQQQQRINSISKLLPTNQKLQLSLKQKQKHSQTTDTVVVEEKKQTHSTHQKSIKPCSNTSLIYKEFEKKNKKLFQQNKKLLEQNTRVKQLRKELKQKIDDYQTLSKQLIKANEEAVRSTQQMSKQKQQIKFLQQQTRILLQQNKKIQQQFQYLVKEKLQLQGHTNNLQKQKIEFITQRHRWREGVNQRMIELHQMMGELQEEKEMLKRLCGELQCALRVGLQLVSDEMVGALDVFINGMASCQSQCQCLEQQQEKQQKRQHQEQELQQNHTAQQQQQQQQSQQQNILIEQYQTLAIEFNHCLYELNQYKTMLNQSQIQKQLQKKYYQEDIQLLQMKLSTIENSQYHNHNNRNNNNSNKVSKQTNSKGDKLKINCELLSIQFRGPTIIQQFHDGSMQTQQEIQLKTNNLPLTINSQTVQLSFYEPSQHIQQRSQHNNSNPCQHNYQHMMTLTQWINELQTDYISSPEQQQFTKFCLFHLSNDQSSKLNQQDNQHDNKYVEQQPIKQYNQKQLTKNQSMEQQIDEKIGIFGSLYNNFTFPKLQPTETKYELNKKPSVKQTNNNCEMDLLKKESLRESSLLNKIPTIPNHQLPVNNIQTQLYNQPSPQIGEDEQQSFDLCII